MTIHSWRPWGLWVLLSTAIAAGCGGGAVGSGGSGSPVVTQGTVSGFGSILVDGQRFDDRDARTETEDEPGASTLAEAKLGHRVEVEYVVDGIAQVVRVEPEARGLVESVGSNGFTVLGQTVRINTDGAAGPVTQFGNFYTSLADVQAGHWVEVHGVPVLEAGGYVIRATRIERRLLPPLYLRVAGIVSATSGSRFTIGALQVETAGAPVLPAGQSISVGRRVVVFARPSRLAAGLLAADLVRIKAFVGGSAESYLGGVIAGYNAGTSSFDLGGVTVRAAGAQVEPVGGVLANGVYVQVRGGFASDGSFVANRVRIRSDGSGPQAELRGTIYALGATTFEVRGVTVNYAAATVRDCGSGLADGVFVEVKGNLGLTGVNAQEVRCETAVSSDSVIERRGTAGNVDVAARTFTLTPLLGAPVAVDWTALTYFKDITPATLQGASVGAEGVLVNGRLVALRIRQR
jgi:hypothetical protein